MKRHPCLLVALALFAFAFPANGTAQGRLTYPELVQRIYDLEQLATPPVPGEKTGASTSHDRRAKYNAENDTYEFWGANDDGGGFIRKEGDAQVLAELTGPGVIWRLWSALPEQGHLQIFIDGATTPVFDAPFRELFRNDKGPFAYSALNHEMARGFNLFVPIAFQKSIKIVGQPGWGRYFHCTHTQFPGGTQVPSFRGTFDDEDRAALAKANDILARRGKLDDPDDTDSTFFGRFIIAPKSSEIILWNTQDEENLSGAVTWIKIESPLFKKNDPATAGVLRELTISFSWDGEKTPSVWAPLSDFFGSGYGANSFDSLPLTVRSGALISNWFMPYSKGAVGKITNDGDTAIDISAWVGFRKLPKSDTDKMLRFHAKWHRNHFGENAARYTADRWPDWPVLLANDTSGGRFVGVTLALWNPFSMLNGDHKKILQPVLPPTSITIPDENKNDLLHHWWWGEGDEKFFVDGEKFPSTFGTGTEDYFGYAWATPHYFDSHAQNQPRNTDNIGHITNSRFHIADNIPFQKSFEAVLEKYHGDNWPLLYAATAYWYQAAGESDAYAEVPLGERVNYFTQPKLKPDALKHDGLPLPLAQNLGDVEIFEAEKLPRNSTSADIELSVQDMEPWGRQNWSSGQQLLARTERQTYGVVLEVPADGTGEKNLFIFPSRAPDYGQIAVRVNGGAVKNFDCYGEKVASAGAVFLGTASPEDGKFLVEINVTGANPKNRSGHSYLGIDAVGLQTPDKTWATGEN